MFCGSLSFLGLQVYGFHYVWKNFNCYSRQYFFSILLILLASFCLRSPMMCAPGKLRFMDASLP